MNHPDESLAPASFIGSHADILEDHNHIEAGSNPKPQTLKLRLQHLWVMYQKRWSLITMFTLSLFLGIGYAINIAEIIASKHWTFIYLISSSFLFVSCCVTMLFVLCCTYVTMLKTLIFILFLIGISGHAAVIYSIVRNSHDIIYWECELLYSLCCIYIMVLAKCSIPAFKISKLMVFSFILFISSLYKLITQFIYHSSPLSVLVMTSYIFVAVATGFLICVHACCFRNYYKSGLFLKLLIVSSLVYNVTVCILQKEDFDKYDNEIRIYYYYVLLGASYVIYSCAIFIEPKGAEIPLFEHHKKSLQYDHDKRVAVFTDKLAKRRVYRNPNEAIPSIINAFPDFKPCKENEQKYFQEIEWDWDGIECEWAVTEKREEFDRNKIHIEKMLLKGSIACIVPFYNEPVNEIYATLLSLYKNFEQIKEKRTQFQKYTPFNVLLIGDGWFKAHDSTKQYLAKLYPKAQIQSTLDNMGREQNKYNTVILQTELNVPVCINPFNNEHGEEELKLNVTTIIKIDNRKKANSHEWFLGKYGFAEWYKCQYMYFTDAYSTLNDDGLYRMVKHMARKKNRDVVCCTGKARIYTIKQEIQYQKLVKETYVDDDTLNDDKNEEVKMEENNQQNDEEENKYDEKKEDGWWKLEIFKDKKTDDTNDDQKTDDHVYGKNVFYKIEDTEYDYRLSINADLRHCQMFEFEAMYGTIGCFLLGGFLPVIPGPCGFYRTSYVLQDNVREWYFDQVNRKNKEDDPNLLLGNMKLAEDRVLTLTSILNYQKLDDSMPDSVRHSLIPDCVFYFDPMPTMEKLTKQRRRWINGSIAAIIFVLRKISFSTHFKWYRRIYVLLLWYMQLFMFVLLFLAPPLLFIISFEYGLTTILDVILHNDNDGVKDHYIQTAVKVLMITSWVSYVAFIYYAQIAEKKPEKCKECKKKNACKSLFVAKTGKDVKLCKPCARKTKAQPKAHPDEHEQSDDDEEPDLTQKCITCLKQKGILKTIGVCNQYLKPKSVKLMLLISKTFGILTLTGSIMQFVQLIQTVTQPSDILKNSVNFFVMTIEVIFFVQTFILAPLFSRDIETLKILLKTGFHYFMYAPFYVVFFFINACCNVHDLSWGTRPEAVTEKKSNPKHTTYEILLVLLLSNIIMALIFRPFTEDKIPHLIFLSILSLPALFQIFFSLIYLGKTAVNKMIRVCLPKEVPPQTKYADEKQSGQVDGFRANGANEVHHEVIDFKYHQLINTE